MSETTFDLDPVLAELTPVVAEAQEIVNLPATVEVTQVVEVTPDAKLQTAENDFDVARNTIKSVLKKAEAALDGIMAVANEDEKARSFEVAANLMKHMSDMATSLVDMHRTMKDVRPKNNDDPGNRANGAYIDKAVFFGSPKDLLDSPVRPKQITHQ